MSFRNDGLWRKARVVENGPAPLFFFFLIVCFSFGSAESPLLLGVSLVAECRGSSLAAVASLWSRALGRTGYSSWLPGSRVQAE